MPFFLLLGISVSADYLTLQSLCSTLHLCTYIVPPSLTHPTRLIPRSFSFWSLTLCCSSLYITITEILKYVRCALSEGATLSIYDNEHVIHDTKDLVNLYFPDRTQSPSAAPLYIFTSACNLYQLFPVLFISLLRLSTLSLQICFLLLFRQYCT